MEDIINEELERLRGLRKTLPLQLDGVLNQIYILERILERKSENEKEEGEKCNPLQEEATDGGTK